MGAQAAAALKLTAASALEYGVIDEILPEPKGGAHRDPSGAAEILSSAISRHLAELQTHSPTDLKSNRYNKFRKMGLDSVLGI
jgi:acetyl-CoA carboxylase carboxyl transferase subunit alpha